MSPWKWTPERTQGIWRHGSPNIRPLVAVAPWISIVLIILMFHIAGGALTLAKGTLFELPEAGIGDGEDAKMVAMVLPVKRETFIFFDDARYDLHDETSLDAFTEHLLDEVRRMSGKSLLILADRRIAGGDLMHLANVAKRSGVERILFAEKRMEKGE